jgi:hypothetical protein
MFTEEIDRRLAERGICYDEDTDRFYKGTRQLSPSEVAVLLPEFSDEELVRYRDEKIDECDRHVYYLAAKRCVLLSCQRCENWLAPADVPSGPKYPDEGWHRSLGDHAFDTGWQIEFGGEWLLISCPKCRLPSDDL